MGGPGTAPSGFAGEEDLFIREPWAAPEEQCASGKQAGEKAR